MTYCQSLQMSVCQIKQEFCCFCHRFWSQQIRNCILMAEGEEWDLGDRSPHHEIQPSPPKPRNNTRWVPLPQPATPPPPVGPLLLFFFSSTSQTCFSLVTKWQQSRQVSRVQSCFFFSLRWFLSLCLAVCVQFYCVEKKDVWMTQEELLYSVCMYVCFNFFCLPSVPSALFSCLFVQVGSCPSVMFFPKPGCRGGRGREKEEP